MGNQKVELITGNESVTEFLHILKANSSPGLNDLNYVFSQISAVKKQLDTAIDELAAMRRDLAEAEKHRHPIKNTLQKAVILMQARVLELRDKLDALKQTVINGCKSAVLAFQEKGITALNDIARFFRVRPALEAIQTTASKAVQTADRVISHIETAGARYHEAGRNFTNAGRALAGKVGISNAKPNGKVLAAVAAPFHVTRTCFQGMSVHAATAVRHWKCFEEKGAARKQPIREIMQEHKKKIEHEKRDIPSQRKERGSPEL